MSKSDSLWYPRYPGDYGRKTQHLSLMEHGAYALLMDHYYSTGNPLPANALQLQRICKAFAAEEIEAMQNILSTFFILSGDKWSNTRVDQELQKRKELSQKRRDAQAKKGTKNNNAIDGTIVGAIADTPTPITTNGVKPPYPLNGQNGVFKNGVPGIGVFRMENHLTDEVEELVRMYSPGWNLQHLCQVYDQGISEGLREAPRSPKKAFPEWCRRYTKGKRP